jgi:hypothetical protein
MGKDLCTLASTGAVNERVARRERGSHCARTPERQIAPLGTRIAVQEEGPVKRARQNLSVAIGIAAALVLAVVPGAAHADELRAANPIAGADAQGGCGGGPMHGYKDRFWPGAHALFQVHQGGSKWVYSYDWDPGGHEISLGIMIDPVGPADPIVYVDPNPHDDNAYQHCFGYKVRKWKWVSTYQGTKRIHGDDLPWQVAPLPHMGF